ncbi:MAG: redoxin family protein [Bacteroidia bacterium]|nr:redoxin family protein [Bacteroidia bacterium]MCF8427188.1 redoxin family protein [Bacteroidia bacterium]MCF8445423.1 redoxin family protein [Bacteroidia bacterium]
MKWLAIIGSIFLLSFGFRFEPIQLKDLSGKNITINLSNAKKGNVVLFLSPECPLCQSYSLTIQQIEKEYKSKGFNFYAIIPGTDFTKEDVIEFRNKYGLKNIPFYFDPKLDWVKFAKASITPEVAVYTPKGEKVYLGRIDNWAYELARKRSVITQHDLLDVLNKLDQNKLVKPYQTKAVGCFIN